MKILSIDAWREPEGGWNWNQWYTVGNIDKSDFENLKTARATIKWFRESGFISDYSKGRVAIDDDGYNVVVCDKNTHEPVFAIEYGPEY